MVTNWPSGSALPKPRKRRKRPVGRVARESRKVAHTLTQVEQNGLKYVPLAMRVTMPEVTDPKDADRCEVCGHAVATLPVVGQPHACEGARVAAHVEIPTGYTIDGGGPNFIRK
jgi:hypothetical protein